MHGLTGRKQSPEHVAKRAAAQTKHTYCTIDGCPGGHEARGLCSTHYRKLRKYGDPLHTPTMGRPRVAGTRHGAGYTYVRHPVTDDRILEHRLVMEQKLERPLLPEENVHHINGVRHDNRLENLELWFIPQPKGQRVEDLVEWAKEVLDLYASP